MVNETWAILENYIKSSEKVPKKKATLVNNSYILEPILILTTQSSCAVCPRVKCKNYDGSNKALKIYYGYNMIYIHQFFRKMPKKKATLFNNSYIFEPILILTT